MLNHMSIRTMLSERFHLCFNDRAEFLLILSLKKLFRIKNHNLFRFIIHFRHFIDHQNDFVHQRTRTKVDAFVAIAIFKDVNERVMIE